MTTVLNSKWHSRRNPKVQRSGTSLSYPLADNYFSHPLRINNITAKQSSFMSTTDKYISHPLRITNVNLICQNINVYSVPTWAVRVTEKLTSKISFPIGSGGGCQQKRRITQAILKIQKPKYPSSS